MRKAQVVVAVLSLALGLIATPAIAAGPDVILSDINGFQSFGPVGSGTIRAFVIGSDTCNIGDENLIWANNGTPMLSMNMYRLANGRFEQIGMGWLKAACCAAAGGGCDLACNGAGGNVLGAGCLDVYGAGWNAGQSRLVRRSSADGFFGTVIGPVGVSGDAITGRCQVDEADLSPANFPGALYFMEGHYVASDDSEAGNHFNNASYARVNVSAGFNLSLAEPLNVGLPAIFAWQNNGLGADVADPNVRIAAMDVPGEGRFYLSARADDNEDGTYTYNYSIYNFNSDRSGGSFTVPVPDGVTVTNAGFHDVDYHSGDPYDNTDWSITINPDSVVWECPQPFAVNPESNALRYSTTYTFWFTTDSPPKLDVVTLGLFKPGAGADPTAFTVTPAAIEDCSTFAGDIDGNQALNGLDLDGFVSCLLGGEPDGGDCGCADMDDSGGTDTADVAGFVAAVLGA